LHEWRRNREKSKPFCDDQRRDELEPGPLLRCEGGRAGWTAVEVLGWEVAIEFGDDVVPDRNERWVGVGCQIKRAPSEADREDGQMSDDKLSTWLSTDCG
jgi:hypothetical protein